mmetsp:Transcript_6461/g.8488  ORF Transcript_6461/g.8488 Transcript_6461/m.8488 type:complete len:468 (+) Transcript_6461:159-1562(+)
MEIQVKNKDDEGENSILHSEENTRNFVHEAEIEKVVDSFTSFHIDEDFWSNILSFVSKASTTAIKLRLVCKTLKNAIDIDYEGMCARNNWGSQSVGGGLGWKQTFLQCRALYLRQSRVVRTGKVLQRPIGGQKGATFWFAMDRTKLVCGGGKMQSDFLKVFNVSRKGGQDTRVGSRLTGQLLGHKGPVTGVHFMQDGNSVLTSSLDKTLRIWQLRSDLDQYNPDDNLRCGQSIGKVEAHEDSVNCCLWDGLCGQVWSGSSDGQVKVWDVSAFSMQFPQPLATYEVGASGGGGCRCLSWSGGSLVFSGDGQGYLHIMDSRVEEKIASVKVTATGRQISTVCALGHRVAAGDWEGVVRMWDTRMLGQGKPPIVYKMKFPSRVNSLQFDEVKLVVGTEDGKVQFFSSVNGGKPWRTLHEDAAIMFVSISGNLVGISKRLSPGDLAASISDKRASIKLFSFQDIQNSPLSP